METAQRMAPTLNELLRQGQELVAQDKLLDARRCYETVLAQRPGDYTAHLKLGQIEGAIGDMVRSERYLLKALALRPGALEAQAELGLLDWRRYNDTNAVARLAPFCKAQPGNLNVASYLAESYAALGQDEAIVDLFEAALRAGAPWTVEKLLPLVRKINVEPACRRGFYRAAARITSGPVTQYLSQRGESDTPLDVPDVPEPWKTLLALSLPQRVSACMIVKNEANTLGRLLASIQQMVDEIIVVDTGSTDQTVAIAESYGARVFHFTWCDDFAAARNESLSHATGDWIMLVDADHEVDLSSRRILKRILQKPMEADTASLLFTVQLLEHYSVDPTVINSRGRFQAIFPNRPYLRFVGALHEQLTDHRASAPSLKLGALPEVIYHHYGYSKAVVTEQDKRARNMRIVVREVELRPDDAFVRFNYAQELRSVLRFDEAIAQLRECFRLMAAQQGNFRSPFVGSAYILYASLLVRRQSFDEVILVCEDGLRFFPDCADLLGRLGMALLARDRTELAIPHLEAALRQHGAIGLAGSNVAYASCLSESLLAIAYSRKGDATRCDRHLRRAIETSVDRQKTVERFVTFCGLLLGERKAAVPLLARIGVKLEYKERSATQVPSPPVA